MNIKVFLPCRKGSERVPKKNVRPFSGYKNGLIELKLRQLIETKSISEIYLSTNDPEILDYAASLDVRKLILHHRADNIATSDTSTDELVEHALNLVGDGDILWTHVTSPFVTAKEYEKIIKKYYEKLSQGYDSLMTTNLLHSFIWNDDGPLNYDRKKEKWPRTQTLKPMYEINSAVFMASSKVYKDLDDRIGNNPYLYPLDKIQGFDIDWEDDFRLAKALIDSGVCKP